MDNISLDRLLQDRQDRTFWLKSIGPPRDDPRWNDEESRTWRQDLVEIHFARRPGRIQRGDILIAYRVRIRKALYVAECLAAAQRATEEQIQRDSFRGRWPWFFPARNLTPEYGGRWNQFNIRPFRLAREYNVNHPDDPASLGAIMHGSGQAVIPRRFAEVLIRAILALPSQVMLAEMGSQG
jgi:hypothetical protein